MSKRVLPNVGTDATATIAESHGMPTGTQAATTDEIPEGVIERLRLSRQESDERNRELGEEAGRDWALQDAEYEELEALQDFHDDMERNPYGHDWEALFAGDADHDPAGALFAAIRSETEVDWNACNEFWVGVGGISQGRVKAPEFFRGFAEEALEVWDEVQRRL